MPEEIIDLPGDYKYKFGHELGPKIWHLETNKKAVIDLIIKLIKYINDCVAENSATFEAGHRWRQASKNNAILVFLPGKN